jgi:broad specificity phosphatase PhoE
LDYDFSKVEKLGPNWSISNDSEENQTKYNEVFSSHQDKEYSEVLKVVFNYMKETFIYETPTNLRRRAERVKEMLKEYRKKYNTIAVVTHYNIIRFTIATEFNEKDEPFHSHIGNCEITRREIDKL